MSDRPIPIFRTAEERLLIGTMSIYATQAEASERIPQQWRAFRRAQPELEKCSEFYGASPCTGDRQIHYLSGVVDEGVDTVVEGERLTLEAGEYAVVHIDDISSLRDTWTWLLSEWLATSGRREKHAPEFERITRFSEEGAPIGPVEIWIPLEPVETV